ncbi:MAG: hypothetical protein WAK27_02365 [Candidatus Sulfotelmatobacter sp.]
MAYENWQWLAAVIGAHPNREVIGRTRLQKTVWLLQRLGLPTDYVYSLHFYGPYSEELKADIDAAEQLCLISEDRRVSQQGSEYFILRAQSSASLPSVDGFRQPIEALANEDATVLELAATYDAFRKMGLDHGAAVESLRAKKGEKCDGGREERAFVILNKLGLLTVRLEDPSAVA